MRSTAGAIDHEVSLPTTATTQLQLRAALSLTLLPLLLGLALMLAARRISGALSQPPSANVIVFTAIMLELAVTACQRLCLVARYLVLSTWQSNLFHIGNGQLVTHLPRLLATFAAFVVLISLAIPGTSVAALALAWVVLIGGELAYWLPVFQPRLLRFQAAQSTSAPRTIAPASIAAETEGPEFPRGLVQQVTRVRESNRESLHGLLKAEISGGDQVAVLHVAFCPPLAARPTLTAHALDADSADVRITHTETFGARLEVRLPSVEQTTRELMIEVLGSVTVPQSA